MLFQQRQVSGSWSSADCDRFGSRSWRFPDIAKMGRQSGAIVVGKPMGRVSGKEMEMKRICCWLVVAALLGPAGRRRASPMPPGQAVSLSDFAGKPLLVNLLRPWCAPACGRCPCSRWPCQGANWGDRHQL